MIVASFSFGAYAVPSNTSFSSATTLTSTVGDQLTVTGLSSGQSQWFRIYANAGDWIYPCIYGISTGEDWDLGLYNSSNSQIDVSANSKNNIEYIGYTVPSSGYYYFKVNAWSVGSTSSSCYFKVVHSCGVSGTGSTNSDYVRSDAKSYMDLYWNSYNSAYANLTDNGGDCTNYVSQILRHGGMAKRGNASSRDAITSWFMDTNISSYTTANYSATWTGANSFTNHWGTNSMGSGNERAYSCKYYIGKDVVNNFSTIKSSLRVGDIVQFTDNAMTSRYHSLAVYSIGSDDVLLSAHTYNTNSMSLKSFATANPTMMIVVIQIKSGN